MMRFIFFIFLLFSTLLRAEESEYQLGQGIQIDGLPLYLGGYFSIEYGHEYDNKRSLSLDELAVMAYGEYNNYTYLLEIEAANVYNEVFGDETSEGVNKEIHIERLFVNYDFNENYGLKLGKFNSPIGFWNRIPINVLRDTSSNPRITELLFPRFTTGADFLYKTENDYEVAIDTIIQGGKDLDSAFNTEIYNNFDLDSNYGFGVSLQNDTWSYQFNTGYFHLTSDQKYYYLLGAIKYEQDNFKIQSEFGTQFNEKGTTIPYIGYLQGSYIFKENHQAILRLEAYENKLTDIKDDFAVIGYTYRPIYPIAVKGEYQWHSLHEENKMIFSISVLF